MTSAEDRFVLRDRELIELLADEPELLAVLDAYGTTQRDEWERQKRWRSRLSRLAMVVSAVAVIGVPAAAFGHEIRQILGFSNSGRPIASERLPVKQLSSLAGIGLPQQQVRLLAERAGIAFYVGRSAAGTYCFAVGFASAKPPRFYALTCQGGVDAAYFPSKDVRVADLSQVALRGKTVQVTRLAGFATDDVARISIRAANGEIIFSTAVSGNVYAAGRLPQSPAAAIVGSDETGKIVYRRRLVARPVRRPTTPVVTAAPRGR